mmetsp:Transcript_5936/g.17176  ORF Transcript_5936/g.17176 Transcript_5936/m.17176 type:complete len:204 (+) Transcript_5936:1846-2457(+)
MVSNCCALILSNAQRCPCAMRDPQAKLTNATRNRWKCLHTCILSLTTSARATWRAFCRSPQTSACKAALDEVGIAMSSAKFQPRRRCSCKSRSSRSLLALVTCNAASRSANSKAPLRNTDMEWSRSDKRCTRRADSSALALSAKRTRASKSDCIRMDCWRLSESSTTSVSADSRQRLLRSCRNSNSDDARPRAIPMVCSLARC